MLLSWENFLDRMAMYTHSQSAHSLTRALSSSRQNMHTHLLRHRVHVKNQHPKDVIEDSCSESSPCIIQSIPGDIHAHVSIQAQASVAQHCCLDGACLATSLSRNRPCMRTRGNKEAYWLDIMGESRMNVCQHSRLMLSLGQNMTQESICLTARLPQHCATHPV